MPIALFHTLHVQYISLVLVHIGKLPFSCFSRWSVSIWTETLNMRLWGLLGPPLRPPFSLSLFLFLPQHDLDPRLPVIFPVTRGRAQSKLILATNGGMHLREGGKAEMKGKEEHRIKNNDITSMPYYNNTLQK